MCSRFWPFNRYVVVYHCCFNLQFPVTYNVEHLYFHIFICHLYISFAEVSDKIFGPYLTGLFVFLLFSFKSSLFILDNSPLSDVSFVNISFLFVAFLSS